MIGFLAIATGGAIGALERYGLNIGAVKLVGTGFPYGTLAVNIVGSFVMGALIAIFANAWQPSETVKLFLITGFLGAFTTFSTFSLDAVVLFERGALLASAVYIAASVCLSIAALFAGLWLIRGVLA